MQQVDNGISVSLIHEIRPASKKNYAFLRRQTLSVQPSKARQGNGPVLLLLGQSTASVPEHSYKDTLAELTKL